MAFEHENTVSGAYGEFIPVSEDTPEVWAQQEADFREWERVEAEYRAEMDADYWSPVEQGYYDDDPSPYAGDYSEM